MALPKDLKSNMTGMPVFDPDNEVVEGTVPPVDASEVTPQEDSIVPAASEVTGFPEKVEDVLKRIENQLASIVETLATKQPAMTEADGISAALARIDQQIVAIADAFGAEKFKSLETMIASLVEKLDRNDRQLTQDLRENATFRVQVRQGMQRDLDELKEQLSGEQFNPILKEIATVYSEYQVLLDEDLSPRARKNLLALFEQLEDILDDYGAEVIRSEVGSVRKTRSCKIINKVLTPNNELHNTIVQSRKPGVIRGQVVLYQELVDVYVYDPNAPVTPTEEPTETVNSEVAAAVDNSTGDTPATNT